MSESRDDDDSFSLDDDRFLLGAAKESVESSDELQRLPRLVRYALLCQSPYALPFERLAAELVEIAPGIQVNEWLLEPGIATGAPLAAELDARAVSEDRPGLRGFADCVRLLSLPLPNGRRHRQHYHRVAKGLLLANQHLPSGLSDNIRADIEQMVYGWAALPLAITTLPSWRNYYKNAATCAIYLGQAMVTFRTKVAGHEIRKDYAEKEAQKSEKLPSDAAQSDMLAPPDHLVVCVLDSGQNVKLREVARPFEAVIGRPLPLQLLLPLHKVRDTLLFEFPYAQAVVDFVLADLVGRRTVKLRPLLLVGEPGGGKSRFVRRLGEALGVHVWRTDASRSDGAVFAGTDKRWHSAEPCHPFLAIAQAKHANPIVLLDELEKAGTRADYGRLWDCLLGFLEPETASRYPDPALQTILDLSEISYVATGNTVDSIPAPLRDRFRLINFPKPKATDLDTLLPAVLRDLAHERRLDPRWALPLNGAEREAVALHWLGGSVRRLRRIVEVTLQVREGQATRN